VPLIIFGLLGGAIADTVDRRTLMLFTSGGTAVASNDGKDTIVDFKTDADPAKSDKLFFTIDIDGDPAALSTAQRTDLEDAFKAKFEIETAFLDAGTTTDTRMSLDDGMSITLLGYDGGNDIWNHVEFSFV
ncbi:MAG: hypothetical protein ACLGHY_12835, partial [Gammaproteobacteria bacterium]